VHPSTDSPPSSPAEENSGAPPGFGEAGRMKSGQQPLQPKKSKLHYKLQTIIWGFSALFFSWAFSSEEGQTLLYSITFKTSPDTVISIPSSSSSLHFSIKLKYTCKLPNCFPLYGISNKPLSNKETFCSNQTLSSSCMTQYQLKHGFQKIL